MWMCIKTRWSLLEVVDTRLLFPTRSGYLWQSMVVLVPNIKRSRPRNFYVSSILQKQPMTVLWKASVTRVSLQKRVGHGHSILLQDRRFARPEVREFLHAVASPAPTCSLLPASVFAVVKDHLLVHGHISDFQAYKKFASDASVLHSLVLSLQKQADGKLDRAAIELSRSVR